MADRAVARKEPVTINFPAAQVEDLRRLAEQESRSLSQQVRHLVARGLEAEFEPETADD
jgi:hypothetical protein